MAVVQLQANIVIAVFRDVPTVAAARAKYPHLRGKRLEPGFHPVGSRFTGGVFTPPVVAPVVEVESEVVLALRELADEIGPVAVAKINTRFGAP